MTVPTLAAVAVLGGAALHAAWNVGIRGGADRRRAMATLVFSTGLCGLLALPFVPMPARVSWPYLAVSACIHVVYMNLVAEAYVTGAVSLAYPAMRGTAPALTALIAAFGFGEALAPNGWAGLLMISTGVGLLARRRGAPGEGRALVIALGNAVLIALYTITDGLGVRLSGAPLAYAAWIFILPALPSALILLRFRPARLFRADLVGPVFRQGLVGGAFSVASYALALWAMTIAPIAAIAALRETSMLFAVVFAWVFLGERPGRRGWSAVTVIALGAILLRVG